MCQQVPLFNSCQYTFLRTSLDATEVNHGESVSAAIYRDMFFNVLLFWLHFCVSKQKVFHVPTVPSMLLSSVIHIFLFLVLNCNKLKCFLTLGQFIRSNEITHFFPYIFHFLYIITKHTRNLFLPRQHLSLLKVSVRFMGHLVLYSVGETSSGHLSRSWSPEESHERRLRVCKQERDSGSRHLHGGLTKLKLLHLSASVNQALSSSINLSIKKIDVICSCFFIVILSTRLYAYIYINYKYNITFLTILIWIE